MTRFALILAAAICSTATIAAPAMAGEPRTMAVSTAGLDLSNPGHVAKLGARVETAVRSVCAPDAWRNVKQVVEAQQCRAKAREGARTQIAALTSGRTQLASVR